MPNRIVRDAILTSGSVCALDWPEEVFYRRLMSVVDDYGRCEANPQLLRSRCYPLQVDKVRVADIARWMAACQKAGLIAHYEVSGKAYLQIEKFGQQQRSASKCPAPPSDADRLLATASNCAQPLANEHLDVFVCGDVDEDVGDRKARKRATPPECPPDVEPQVWSDWCALRKSKRATVSETVVAGAREEATKAGMSLSDFLRVWCVRGSQGLQAEWLKPHERQQAAQSFRERDAELAKAEAAKWMGSYARQNVIDLEDITDARTPRLAQG